MVEKTYNDVFVLIQTKKKSWFVFPIIKIINLSCFNDYLIIMYIKS